MLKSIFVRINNKFFMSYEKNYERVKIKTREEFIRHKDSRVKSTLNRARFSFWSHMIFGIRHKEKKIEFS